MGTAEAEAEAGEDNLTLATNNPRATNLRQRRDKKIVGLRHAADQRPFDTAVALAAEERAVKQNHKNPLWLMTVGLVAAVKVFAFFLLSLETLIVLGLTIAVTLFWYFTKRNDPDWGARYMDWFLVGFAIVGPMSASLTISFNRRESALLRLSQFRSYANHIYLAHALWDWDDGKGRASSDVDWIEHTDKVMAQLIGMGDELSRFLRLPTATRSRHRMTKAGRNEASRIMIVGYQLYESLSIRRMNRLSKYGERIKAAGLGPSEASRIRQYERFLGETVEGLRHVKMYRTPQTLRSFARIFTMVLPPFYAPTFAALAVEVQSLAIGILMSIITTMTLMALYESIQVMEDPFVAYRALDGIDVREELEVLLWRQLVETRKEFFANAPPYPKAPRHPLLKQDTNTAQASSVAESSAGLVVSLQHDDTEASVSNNEDPELGFLMEEKPINESRRARRFEIEDLEMIQARSNYHRTASASMAESTDGGSFKTRKSRLRLFSNEEPIYDL